MLYNIKTLTEELTETETCPAYLRDMPGKDNYMISRKTKRLTSAGAVAVCIAVIGCANTYVYAEPSSAELEQKTSDLQGELSSLNSQLDELIGQMDSMSQEAEDLAEAMAETQERLDEAQIKGEEQYEAMKLRIKYMYEAGDTSFLELVCSAKSMSDFLNKTDFVQTISEYDRNMLDELLATQEEIAEEGDLLKEQHQELVAKQEDIQSKRQEVEEMISSTSGELSDYSAQLERARQAEALAAAQAAKPAQQEPAGSSQPSGSGGQGGGSASVPPAEYTPGDSSGKQSLGSFRITHYCPCFYCCGSWAGGNTASGTRPTPGRTIAVDPSVIPLGTRVIINGQVYVAEDTGGAIKGNKIDIFVADHSTALAYGVYYAEVYLAN